jgi:hypothetical protein
MGTGCRPWVPFGPIAWFLCPYALALLCRDQVRTNESVAAPHTIRLDKLQTKGRQLRRPSSTSEWTTRPPLEGGKCPLHESCASLYLVKTPPSECADEFDLVQHISFKLLGIAGFSFHHQFVLLCFRYNARRLNVFGLLGDFFGILGTSSSISTLSQLDGVHINPTLLTFGAVAFRGPHDS